MLPSLCLLVCASEARLLEASVCLMGDVVALNNEGDHLSMDGKWFCSFLHPFSPVLVYCSHSSKFPLSILCAQWPGNVVIYSDMKPANHNSSSLFLLFLILIPSSSCPLLLFSISLYSFTVIHSVSLTIPPFSLHSCTLINRTIFFYTTMLLFSFFSSFALLLHFLYDGAVVLSTAQKCWGSPDRPHIDWYSLTLQCWLFILCFFSPAVPLAVW